MSSTNLRVKDLFHKIDGLDNCWNKNMIRGQLRQLIYEKMVKGDDNADEVLKLKQLIGNSVLMRAIYRIIYGRDETSDDSDSSEYDDSDAQSGSSSSNSYSEQIFPETIVDSCSSEPKMKMKMKVKAKPTTTENENGNGNDNDNDNDNGNDNSDNMTLREMILINKYKRIIMMGCAKLTEFLHELPEKDTDHLYFNGVPQFIDMLSKLKVSSGDLHTLVEEKATIDVAEIMYMKGLVQEMKLRVDIMKKIVHIYEKLFDILV